MKANQFRVGNLVGVKKSSILAEVFKVDNVSFEIEELRKEKVSLKRIPLKAFYKELKPIELDEDLLKLYGFKVYTENLVYNGWRLGENPITHDYLLELYWMKDEDGTLGKCFYRNGHFVIKYFHQLQNLYFALTNTELEAINKQL